jgi:polysaccharide deacetylase 2 family uncharacterized protein YibQ
VETTRNAFSTAFFQGLVVVFFIYVVIFTVTIVQSRKPDATPGATLASADIAISRAVETTTEAVPPLDPTDQDPVPENTHTETTPDPAAEASAEDLIEVTPQGPLPKRSPTGITPFNTYKKDFTHDGKPVIALAVLDYGLSEADSKQALQKLPSEVSLILSPYAATQDAWKSLANAEGHEFWVQVPLENEIYPISEDPGPQALLVHTDFKNNQEKFLWALSRTSGYVGIAGYTDAAFLNAQTALKTLWDEGYNRGIGFLEINPSGLEGVEMNAIEKQAPYVRNNSIYNETIQTPEQWLAALEQEASNNGFAVGVIRNPYPKIVESIAGWAMGLPGRGFALAPVSALAQAKTDAAAPAPAPAENAHHAPAP